MNTMILYASKYGCTMDCAVALKNKLSGNVKLVDIQGHNNQIKPEQYDTVIIGSSIYIGAVPKEIRKFCADNLNVLSEKKLGIFLCCGNPEQIDEYLQTNFPEPIVKIARVVKVFGGEARLEKMKFLDKLIIKAATKGGFQSLKILPDRLEEFVRQMED